MTRHGQVTTSPQLTCRETLNPAGGPLRGGAAQRPGAARDPADAACRGAGVQSRGGLARLARWRRRRQWQRQQRCALLQCILLSLLPALSGLTVPVAVAWQPSAWPGPGCERITCFGTIHQSILLY